MDLTKGKSTQRGGQKNLADCWDSSTELGCGLWVSLPHLEVKQKNAVSKKRKGPTVLSLNSEWEGGLQVSRVKYLCRGKTPLANFYHGFEVVRDSACGRGGGKPGDLPSYDST